MKWGIVRMPKNKKKIEVDVNVSVDGPEETPHTEMTYKEINESEELPYEDLPQDEFKKKDEE